MKNYFLLYLKQINKYKLIKYHNRMDINKNINKLRNKKKYNNKKLKN